MTFAFGSVLAGFGKGKFRDGSAQAAESGEVEFTCSCDAYGVLDNKPMTFGEMMDQEKSKGVVAQMCYHKVVQEPSGKWDFEQEMGWWNWFYAFHG